MAKANPANLLALAQKEYDKQKAELDAALAKKTSELLLDVKKELAEQFGDALTIFNSIPLEQRKTVLTEPAFEMVLTGLGLQIKSEKPAGKARGTRTPRVELTEENVLRFIGEESKTKSECTKYFAGGNVKVVELLDSLVKAKKLTTFKFKGKGKPADAYKKA